MKVTILYGSQTGTAQDVAERMTRQAIQLNLHPKISSLDAFHLEDLKKEDYCVFITSTTGQGEEPDNMKKFWKYLCKRNLPSIFSGVKYCVMGLGDSSYAKYNFVAKKLHKRISQLGGESILPVGLADDQHDLGIEAVIPHWIRSVWKAILGIDVQNVSGVIGPKFKVVTDEQNGVANGYGPEAGMNGVVNLHGVKNEVINGYNNSEPDEIVTPSGMRLNRILSTKRVTSPDHFQDVRFIEISRTNIDYEPGDVLAVQPDNCQENVNLFFELFPSLNPDQKIKLLPQYSWISIPSHLEDIVKPFTWQKVAQRYLDIQSVPTKSFFEYLFHFSTDETEKEKLMEFCTPEGADDLYKYCFKPRRNILEVLTDFPHTTKTIPTDYIFDLIPPIRARSFSIANHSPDNVGILVSVVEYKTFLKKPRKGLCSNWLAQLNVGDVVPCWVTNGSFNFPPPEKNVPVVMIGPGTGCAPFNSLISKRIPMNSQNQHYLFFGCRFADKDYFFQKEWAEFNEKGKLNLFVAFSRDADSKFKYVQDQILDKADVIFDLVVAKKAVIYVAGNAKRMPADVQEAIATVLGKGGIPDPEAYVKNLVRVGRYQTEVWA